MIKVSSKRIIIIILTALFLIGSVVVYKFLTKPAYEEILNLRGKISSLEETFDSYESFKKQADNLLSQYQDLTNIENQFSLILPSKPDISYAIGQINGLARLSGMELQSINIRPLAIKPSSQKMAKGLGILRLELRLAGGYDGFKSFLKDVENNIMISEPINFRIEKQARPELLYTMTIDTYYQAE
ncbi:MAG: type 4a pilus biogenesis protein PilO [Patescibacteria group bacterium]